jgi:hypothetical protein
MRIVDRGVSVGIRDLNRLELEHQDLAHVRFLLLFIDEGNEKLSLNKTGSYFHSRFRSNTSNVFGRSNRPALGQKTLSPGPGG